MPKVEQNSEQIKSMVKSIQALSDEELYEELRAIVNEARFKISYNRDRARAIGEECRKRGIIKPRPGYK